MLKFIYVTYEPFRAPYMIPKMHKEADHPGKYSEEERYELARHVIRLMKRLVELRRKHMVWKISRQRAAIMMYPNHQGSMTHLVLFIPIKTVLYRHGSYKIQYDPRSGIYRSAAGKRLDKKDVRQALPIINEVSEDVKKGKRYILFSGRRVRFQ